MPLSTDVRRKCLSALFFGVFATRALAADPPYTCKTGWDWASNSRQQTPCEVAAVLEAACPGAPAPGCECNTVLFSLIMACTTCQNGTTQSWTDWSGSCAQVSIAQYPRGIPPGTAVPNWAFLDYSVGNGFDPAAAEDAGDQPERLSTVTGTVSSPDSSTSSGTMSSGSPSSVIASSTSTPTGNDQQNNTQARGSVSEVIAIIGGVVGGLVFLAAVGVGAQVFLRIRKKSKVEADKEDGIQLSRTQLYGQSNSSTLSGQSDLEMSGADTIPLNKDHYAGVAKL